MVQVVAMTIPQTVTTAVQEGGAPPEGVVTPLEGAEGAPAIPEGEHHLLMCSNPAKHQTTRSSVLK